MKGAFADFSLSVNTEYAQWLVFLIQNQITALHIRKLYKNHFPRKRNKHRIFQDQALRQEFLPAQAV